MLLKRFNPNPRQYFFGESRTPAASLEQGVESIKGGLSKAKGEIKKVGEKAGKVKGISKRFGKWLITPTGILTSPIKVPAWAAHKVASIPYNLYKGANEYTKLKSAELIVDTRDGSRKVFNRVSNIAYSGGRAGYYLTVAPPLEAVYGNTVRFTKRAVVDNYFATFNGLYNIPATFVGRTINFGKETGRWIANLFGIRNALSNTWAGITSVFRRQFKEAGKNFAMAPCQPFYQTAKVPLALGAIPAHTVAQAAVSAADVGTNMACAMMTPAETTLNGYRSMAKSTDFFKDVGIETGKSRSYRERIGNMRGKIGNIFKHREGFAFI